MIRTAHLFRPLNAELLALLRGLPEAAWARPTSARSWRVRDVAAHLLDGDLRRISSARDGHLPPSSGDIRGYGDLVRYLDDLNAEWIAAARRLSPRLLVELLELTGERVAALVEGADPLAPALHPVAWAGEAASRLWLDHGREYTERWHHQDQIRTAVGAPPLRERRWLRPVLDVSLLALPHAYRNTEAPPGTVVLLRVDGGAGGEWALRRTGAGWPLVAVAGTEAEAACRIRIPDQTLARLLLHTVPESAAAAEATVEGEARLAAPLFAARAVMVARGDPDQAAAPTPSSPGARPRPV